MQTLRESGYKGWPTLHNIRDVCFVWHSRSQKTGRQTSGLSWMSFSRTKHSGKLGTSKGTWLVPVLVPTEHYQKSVEELCQEAIAKHRPPRLRKGQEWVGPFLYMEPRAPMPFGDNGTCILMEKAPERSAGIPLGYGVGPGFTPQLVIGAPA
jgi:hypothetical protein